MNASLWTPTLSLFAVAVACFCAAAVTIAHAEDIDARHSADDLLPPTLHATGLHAKAGDREVAPGLVEFTPQYPLWSDGAAKRRWLSLPAGTSIDASKPDHWEFPRGTRLWKEFSHDGRPVETRYIERTQEGTWRFAAYVWNEAGTEATLASKRGTVVPVAQAPGGRYDVPSRTDCVACHGSAPVPVLGASAVQLSSSLRALVEQGLVRNLPAQLVREPPQIAASGRVERAALGYLHGNCAHCHNTGPNRAPLALTLAQRAADPAASREEVLRSTLGAESRYRPSGAEDLDIVIQPGSPERSVLMHRMRSRDPRIQMPPLGTDRPDEHGIALLRRWIGAASLASNLKEIHP